MVEMRTIRRAAALALFFAVGALPAAAGGGSATATGRATARIIAPATLSIERESLHPDTPAAGEALRFRLDRARDFVVSVEAESADLTASHVPMSAAAVHNHRLEASTSADGRSPEPSRVRITFHNY